ncbi:MAG: bifunctional nuclease family protein [Methanomicrobiales archaeon]|nr:bifunctional nuclease family protein [Methanomicrobiales archaeon]
MDLIPCTVHGVFLSVNGNSSAPTVLLDVGNGSSIPIYIGLWEAISIGHGIDKGIMPRPFTHDLFMEVMKKFGISVEALHIDSLEDSVFYGKLILVIGETRKEIDCRPSDGIAIVLRAGAPILVDRAVVTAAALQREDLPKMVDIPLM